MDFQILSDDYSKAVFLCQDRTVNFHAKFGAYYKTRIVRSLGQPSPHWKFAAMEAAAAVACSGIELQRMLLPWVAAVECPLLVSCPLPRQPAPMLASCTPPG